MEPLLDEIAALDDAAGTAVPPANARQELVSRSKAAKAVRSATAEPRARSPLTVGATVGVIVLLVLVGLIVAALR
jgi:hypothetical protein